MGRDDDIHDTKSKRYKAMVKRHAEYTKQLKAEKVAARTKAKKKPTKKKPVKKKSKPKKKAARKR